MLALPDKWLWDFWIARDGDTWHMFFLQADKSLGNPDLRHWNVSIGHATSHNLTDWDYLGTCFAPAASPAWDDYTTWTGSVMQGPDGTWHFYYTGTSHADQGLKQRLGHAVSKDLHHWQRVEDGFMLDLDTRYYEEHMPNTWHDRAFRDPWVIPDPDGDGWLMFFTARIPDCAEANSAGAIGLATSQDLYSWQIQKPVYAGGDFGQLEVPQVQKIGDKWYCLFATTENFWSHRYAALYGQPGAGGTHYLVADHPKGPWRTAEDKFLDGDAHCPRYSGKMIDTGAGYVFMSFENNDAAGNFIGVINDPRPIEIDADGRIIFSVPSQT